MQKKRDKSRVKNRYWGISMPVVMGHRQCRLCGTPHTLRETGLPKRIYSADSPPLPLSGGYLRIIGKADPGVQRHDQFSSGTEIFTKSKRLADAERKSACSHSPFWSPSPPARSLKNCNNFALVSDNRPHANDYRIFPATTLPSSSCGDGEIFSDSEVSRLSWTTSCPATTTPGETISRSSAAKSSALPTQ
jgi:hypothetical protein